MNLTQYETDSLETFYNFVNLKNKSNENLKKIRVCLYLRKSQEDEKDNSLNLQKTEIDKFICKLNTEFKDKYQFFYDENDVFAEDNRSGIATSHREEFNRMIDFINDNPGYYGMCLVFKLDRFSRNTEDTAHFTRILREKYCLLKALNFEDQGTPESKLFLTMMSAVSQFHAQNSAKLSIDGTKQKVLQHKCVGALPFGLTTSKQQNNTNEVGASNIVIDEQKSKIVKEIFTKYSEGMSLTDLTEYLEKRGYRNNNGNYFSRHQLYNMLRNKRYNGTYIYADKSRKRKRKYDNGVVKPKYYEKNNAIPKIIDDDLFNMVQMIIKSKENSRDVSTSISSYLLSGRLVCKCCGSKLVGDSGTSGRNHTKYRYYTCPNYKSKKNKCTTKKINADYLESAIKRLVSTISNILVETQKIKIKTDIKKKLIKSSNEIANLKKDIIRKETQIGKLVLRCIDDEQRCSIYEKQIDKFTKEVEDMKLNLEVLEIEYNLEKDDLEGTIDQMKLSYEELFNNATYTKTLISNLIKEIKCDNENINIILNLKDE